MPRRSPGARRVGPVFSDEIDQPVTQAGKHFVHHVAIGGRAATGGRAGRRQVARADEGKGVVDRLKLCGIDRLCCREQRTLFEQLVAQAVHHHFGQRRGGATTQRRPDLFNCRVEHRQFRFDPLMLGQQVDLPDDSVQVIARGDQPLDRNVARTGDRLQRFDRPLDVRQVEDGQKFRHRLAGLGRRKSLCRRMHRVAIEHRPALR
jgi:DNA-directed RNA polymerase subunit N (RpoN/RPB10)